MKKIRLNSLVAILIAVVMLAGCKKDEDNKIGPEGYVAPSIKVDKKIVEIPAAVEKSNDPNLSYVKSLLTSINAYSSVPAALANVPAGAELVSTKSTTKTWRWTSGEFTMWVEFTDGDLSYNWKLYYQDDQYFADKTLVLEASEDKLGVSGYLKIYYGFETPLVTYNWEKIDDTVYADIIYDMEGYYVKYEILVSEDGSGELDLWMGETSYSATKIFHVDWNSSGHGAWWFTDGEETYDGTF